MSLLNLLSDIKVLFFSSTVFFHARDNDYLVLRKVICSVQCNTVKLKNCFNGVKNLLFPGIFRMIPSQNLWRFSLVSSKA